MGKPTALVGHMHVRTKADRDPKPHVDGPVTIAGQRLRTGMPGPGQMTKGAGLVRINCKGAMRVNGTAHRSKTVMGAGQRAAHSSGKLFQISSAKKFEGTSKVWEIRADDTLLLSAPGGYVEINKTGVRIRGLKVLIEGNAIDFKSGGPGEGAQCLRAMAKSATPFVR